MKGSTDKNPRVQARNRDRREKAGQLEELAHNRRAGVYKTDPELFTGHEIVRTKRAPKLGFSERAAFDARILELVDEGKTHLQIHEELGIHSSHITRLTTARKRGLR